MKKKEEALHQFETYIYEFLEHESPYINLNHACLSRSSIKA